MKHSSPIYAILPFTLRPSAIGMVGTTENRVESTRTEVGGSVSVTRGARACVCAHIRRVKFLCRSSTVGLTGSCPGRTTPAPSFDAFVCTVLEASLHLPCTGIDRERWRSEFSSGGRGIESLWRHSMVGITAAYARLTHQNRPFTGMWGV